MGICKNCGKEKDSSEFYKRKCYKSEKRKDMSICKKCTDERKKIYDRDPINKEKARIRASEHKKRNPQKHKARNAVYQALKKGKIKRMPCVICGSQENVQAHHYNYNKPLNITWLCIKHHRYIHLNNIKKKQLQELIK